MLRRQRREKGGKKEGIGRENKTKITGEAERKERREYGRGMKEKEEMERRKNRKGYGNGEKLRTGRDTEKE